MIVPEGAAGDRRLPSWFWEVSAALILLTWRVVWYPWSGLWRDWVVILSLYWIFTACAGKSRAWPAATLLVMLWLFAVYASGQIPLTMDLLRLIL
jgi:hypothetical protein